MGDVCSATLSPSNCASAGGVYDSDNEDCNCGSAPATSAPAAAISCAAGSSSACGWFDDIYASDGCLAWYAQCDPTNSFYLVNSKGLIAGGSQVLGQSAGNAIATAGNSLLGLDPNAIPAWAWIVGLGTLGVLVLPKLLGGR
jgi:hypothetical protein